MSVEGVTPTANVDLNEYRDEKGNIDLLAAFNDWSPRVGKGKNTVKAEEFLRGVMVIQPVGSRQAAAIALAQARAISNMS